MRHEGLATDFLFCACISSLGEVIAFCYYINLCDIFEIISCAFLLKCVIVIIIEGCDDDGDDDMLMHAATDAAL